MQLGAVVCSSLSLIDRGGARSCWWFLGAGSLRPPGRLDWAPQGSPVRQPFCTESQLTGCKQMQREVESGSRQQGRPCRCREVLAEGPGWFEWKHPGIEF